MSDEKEAAARRPYYDRAASALDPFTANAYGMAWRALDASGVWERIEELERELEGATRKWDHAGAVRLRAENARLREALGSIARARVLPQWAWQAARAALAETQETT